MNLVSRLTSYKNAYLHGRALGKFLKGNFKESARLFEKVCALESHNDERRELTFAYLGRCYLHLERYNEALKYLSMAFNEFNLNQRIHKFESEIERNEFSQFIKAYIYTLKHEGQLAKSLKIEQKAKKHHWL